MTAFIPVPVSFDVNGRPDYDGWILLERDYKVEIDIANAHLRNGDIDAFRHYLREHGISHVEVSTDQTSIEITLPNTRNEFLMVTLCAFATLYKVPTTSPLSSSSESSSSAHYVPAPVRLNPDGSGDYEGWTYLQRKYKLPVNEIRCAIVDRDYDRAIRLSHSDQTYGERVKHQDGQIFLGKNKSSSAPTDNVDYNELDEEANDDEFIIFLGCNSEKQRKLNAPFVTVRVDSEVTLYVDSRPEIAGRKLRINNEWRTRFMKNKPIILT